ncbi:taste receptor type 2 member 8-like [Pelodytes ibericus]
MIILHPLRGIIIQILSLKQRNRGFGSAHSDTIHNIWKTEEVKMFTAKKHVIAAIDMTAIVVSIPGNIFIVLVNILDLIKKKRLCVTDQLITVIGICSLLHQSDEFVLVFNGIITARSLRGQALEINHAYFMGVLLCYLWCSTMLCVHFCLKIVKINNKVYIYLQRTFPKLFPWLFVPSIVVPALVSFPVVLGWRIDTLPSNTTVIISNQTVVDAESNPKVYYWPYQAYFAVSSLGVLLCSLSAGTIIHSLFRHMKQLRVNVQGPRSPSIEAHIHAVKTLTSILMLNIALFSSSVVTIFNKDGNLWVIMFPIVTSVCHILSSLSQVKGNNKLNKTLSAMWVGCGTCQTQLSHDA